MIRFRTYAAIALVICLGAAVHAITFYGGPQVVDGPDVKIHYRWALQFAQALSEGYWYPRWASYSYFGLGDPTFLYIHPLFYYAVAAVQLIMGSAWQALLIVVALSSAASAGVTYWFARKQASVALASAAGIAVALSPYAFHLAHYQQFLPMYFALPPLILFLGIVTAREAKYRIPLTALTLALLVMSHVLAAFMALVCTSVAMLWRAWRMRQGAIRLLLEHGAGVSFGLALSAIYLLPALTTQHLITPSGWYVPIYIDWRNAFLLQYLTLPDFGFRWFHLQWTIPMLTVLVSGLSAVFLWLGRSAADQIAWKRAADMLVITCVALLLGSELTYPLWAHVETLRRLQFPLRFLQIASIASIFAMVWSASCIPEGRKRLAWIFLGLFLVGNLGMLLALERQFANEAKPALQVEEPGTKMRGQPEMKPASAGEAWQAYLAQGGFEGECERKALRCERTLDLSHRKQWTVQASTAVDELALPLFYFPGWVFTVNGAPETPRVAPDTGLPLIAVRPGLTTIEARWQGIVQERIGQGISLVTMILLVLISLILRARRSGAGLI